MNDILKEPSILKLIKYGKKNGKIPYDAIYNTLPKKILKSYNIDSIYKIISNNGIKLDYSNFESELEDYEIMKELVKTGIQKKGLTFDDINNMLPEHLLNSDKIEDVLTILEKNNIHIVDDNSSSVVFNNQVTNNKGEKITDNIEFNTDSVSEEKLDNFLYIPSNLSISENQKPVLGVEKMADSFARIIDNTKNINNFGIFGVLGSWGRGKTFFIKYIKINLINKQSIDYKIIDFSAWQYQKAPELWAHLFETIAEKRFSGKNKLINILHYNFISNKAETITKLLIPVILFLLGTLYNILNIAELYDLSNLLGNILLFTPPTLMSIIIIVKNSLKDNKKLVTSILKKQFSRKNFTDVLGIQSEICHELQLLLKSWIPENKINSEKIVLVVDDIDRCKSENILDFLDSLRVILENDIISTRLKVIIAIDHHIIKSQLEKNFNKYYLNTNFLTINKYIRDYFDKIFLFSIHLAPLSKTDRMDIIDSIASIKKEDKNTFNNNYDYKISTPEDIKFHNGSYQHLILKSESLSVSEYEINIFKGYFSEINCSPRRIRILYYRYLYIKMLLQINDQSFFEKNHFSKVLEIMADYEKKNTFINTENKEILEIIKSICFD